jgi:hypothetical protein
MTSSPYPLLRTLEPVFVAGVTTAHPPSEDSQLQRVVLDLTRGCRGPGSAYTARVRSLAALVATAAAVALASPAAAVRPAPVLRLAQARPLLIAGSHFAPRERVTVTVHARQPFLRRVITRADGSFSVSFGTAAAAPCGALMADAVGAVGDRASLRIPRQACLVPPTGTS